MTLAYVTGHAVWYMTLVGHLALNERWETLELAVQFDIGPDEVVAAAMAVAVWLLCSGFKTRPNP